MALKPALDVLTHRQYLTADDALWYVLNSKHCHQLWKPRLAGGSAAPRLRPVEVDTNCPEAERTS